MTTCGVIGDTHLDRVLNGFNTTQSTRSVMYEFYRWCVAQQVSFAVHVGDVGDRPSWSIEQQKLVIQWCNEFERSRIPLFILAGNHDVTSRPGAATALDALQAVQFEYVRVIDRPAVEVVRGMPCLFLPFPSPSLYRDDGEWLAEVDDAVSALPHAASSALCFAHLNVDGAKLGSQEWVYRGEDYVLPDLPDSVSVVINGHIHKPQRMGNVKMIGAANRLNFDERDSPRRFLLVSQDGKCTPRRVRAALKLSQIEIDVSNWSTDGTPPTTSEVVASLADYLIRDRLVKVIPMVDERSAVSWSEVSDYLYQHGARFVEMAPPIMVRPESKKVHAKADEDPTRAVKRFIRYRVDDKAERRAILERFRRMQKESDDADGCGPDPGRASRPDR